MGQKLVKQQYPPTCSHNMVNFGPLVAEIVSLVWGTPANFNRFHVLAALLHGSHCERQPNFAALNRGRHLCSAWATITLGIGPHSSFIFFSPKALYDRPSSVSKMSPRWR